MNYDNSVDTVTTDGLELHTVFDEGDKIVFVDDYMHDELMTISSAQAGEVWMDKGSKRCSDLTMIRHATGEEIKAGKRLFTN